MDLATKRRRVYEGAEILWVDDRPSNNRNESWMLRSFGALITFACTTDEALGAIRDANTESRPFAEEQLAQFAKIVEAGPDREKDGIVRWRRVDLKRVIAERFGVDFHPRYVGKLLKKLGFSHISARPRHPAQDERIVEGFKKTSRAR